jgi:hypothetical protein
MKVHAIDQRSEAWATLRLGRLTGSSASDMLATVKSGEAAARRNLRVRLALERVTQRSGERGFISGPMQDGIDREDAARAHYEALTGNLIQSTGFIEHDTLMAGCSLDGHFGDFEGIVEIKCPTPAVHLEYLETGLVPTDYQRQVTHNLWITGAQWCDWLSFHPDFPEELQVKLVRVTRDEGAIGEYERRARQFLQEVSDKVASIERLRLQAVA